MKPPSSNPPIPPFAWYLDLTPSQMFSLYDYPITGKAGLPLCAAHGRQLELKEVVVNSSSTVSRVAAVF